MYEIFSKIKRNCRWIAVSYATKDCGAVLSQSLLESRNDIESSKKQRKELYNVKKCKMKAI